MTEEYFYPANTDLQYRIMQVSEGTVRRGQPEEEGDNTATITTIKIITIVRRGQPEEEGDNFKVSRTVSIAKVC